MTGVITNRFVAFDVGSGKTKYLVADVSDGHIKKVLFSDSVALEFAKDLAQNSSHHLSDQIQKSAIEAFKKIKEQLKGKFQPKAYAGVGTDVFRDAKNGQLFLGRLEKELGITIKIISQKEEARLGWQTGVGSGSFDQDQLVIWDFGARSLQLTAKEGDEIVSYDVKLGTFPATKILLEEVQKKKYAKGESPNPISRKEALALVNLLQEKFPSVPKWLTKKKQFVAIGGDATPFGIFAKVKEEKIVSSKDLWAFIAQQFGKEDEHFQHYCDVSHETTLPRLLLAYAMMQKVGIEAITWLKTNGTTRGILTDPFFW